MKYAFITGVGRSGSTFLSRLLSLSSNAHVHHEYIGDREFWLLSYYLSHEVYTIPFLERQMEKINKEFDNGERKLFIDVNPGLHFSVEALQVVFGGSSIFHLVRDPRKVIPSLYVRRSDRNTHIVPKTRDEVEFWMDADKFGQVCWNWANAVSSLLEQNAKLIIFEKIVSDYDYLCEVLLDPLDLQISRDEWESVRSVRVKKTHGVLYRYIYSMMKRKEFINDRPIPYEKWSGSHKEVFSNVCGEVAKRLGYNV